MSNIKINLVSPSIAESISLVLHQVLHQVLNQVLHQVLHHLFTLLGELRNICYLKGIRQIEFNIYLLILRTDSVTN